jgi:integrase
MCIRLHRPRRLRLEVGDGAAQSIPLCCLGSTRDGGGSAGVSNARITSLRLMVGVPIRRGWRERVEPGVYREHRVACPSSADRRPGRRCDCPYTVTVTGTAGRTIQRSVAGSLSDARRERGRLRSDAGSARAVSDGGGQTLHAFATMYLRAKSATLRPATLASYDLAYRTRIAPHLGALRLDELTRERLEIWLAGLVDSDPRTRSIEHAVETLCSMLGTAVEWSRIPANPAARLRLPKGPIARASERVLTVAQLERLYRDAGSLRGETMLRAAAEAGLRRGEIIGLRWRNVFPAERRLLIIETVWQSRAADRVVQAPKSGRARRVAITPTLAEQLRLLEADTESDADDYVWPGRGGGPMHKDSPPQFLERVLRRAELVDADGSPLVSFHGLRHTAASVGLARGVPLITVSQQLGHARVDITAKVYAHLLDDSQLDAFAGAHENTVLGETGSTARRRSTKLQAG